MESRKLIPPPNEDRVIGKEKKLVNKYTGKNRSRLNRTEM